MGKVVSHFVDECHSCTYAQLCAQLTQVALGEVPSPATQCCSRCWGLELKQQFDHQTEENGWQQVWVLLRRGRIYQYWTLDSGLADYAGLQ